MSRTDPFAEFDLICEFPFAIDAFSELRKYIRAVNEFMPYVAAQQSIRISARLKKASDPVSQAEMESELEAVGHDASIVLPRIIWGGVLVSVFAAFEYGVKKAINHWQVTVGHPVEFKILPRKDFIKSAEAYSTEQMQLPLFMNPKARQTLMDLKAFRNSFAHGSGLLSDLPAHIAEAISKKAHPGASLEIEDGQWVGNARSAAYYLLSGEKAINAFGESVLDKCLAHHRAQRSEV